MGKHDLAAREFQRSLDDGIEDVSSLYHLAQIAREQGDEKRAAKLLEKARQFGRTAV